MSEAFKEKFHLTPLSSLHFLNTQTTGLFIKILLVIASAQIIGCVAIPYPSHKVFEGRELTDESLAWITLGVTTRTQIVERFGEPDVSFKEQNVIAYVWSGQTGRVLYAAYGGAAGNSAIKMRRALMMEFSANDEVTRYSIINRPTKTSLYEYHAEPHIQAKDDWRRILKQWRENVDVNANECSNYYECSANP